MGSEMLYQIVYHIKIIQNEYISDIMKSSEGDAENGDSFSRNWEIHH